MGNKLRIQAHVFANSILKRGEIPAIAFLLMGLRHVGRLPIISLFEIAPNFSETHCVESVAVFSARASCFFSRLIDLFQVPKR